MSDLKDLDLDELKKILDLPYPKTQGPTFARLEDEDNPDGAVIIENENGKMLWMMPRDVYDQLREMKLDKENL